MTPVAHTALAYEEERGRVKRQPLLDASLVGDHIFQIQLVACHLQLLAKIFLLVSWTWQFIAEIVMRGETFLLICIAGVDVKRLLGKMGEGRVQRLNGLSSIHDSLMLPRCSRVYG